MHTRIDDLIRFAFGHATGEDGGLLSFRRSVHPTGVPSQKKTLAKIRGSEILILGAMPEESQTRENYVHKHLFPASKIDHFEPPPLYSIDVETRLKAPSRRLAALALALVGFLTIAAPASLFAQDTARPTGPPKNPGIFPLSQVRRGLTGTAWTVFEGNTPEPMQVEILGILRGARGPGQDMILAQLRGAKPEYTGVVEGMSGSPVYVDGKLLGSISYRIGMFTKDPIAGITPIEQILEVRDLALHDGELREAAADSPDSEVASSDAPTAALSSLLSPDSTSAAKSAPGLTDPNTTFRPMETPIIMGGFSADAIRFWQEHTAGTSLENRRCRWYGRQFGTRSIDGRGSLFSRSRFGGQHAACARRP